MHDWTPAEVFPPGIYLKEELEARGWIQSEFAEIIGKPPALVNQVIMGKRAITPETASLIAAALGTSAELWLNLEAAHQLHNRTPTPAPRIRAEAEIRSRFPVRELIKRGWIEASDDVDVLRARVLAFYGIASLDEQPRLQFAARKSAAKNAAPGNFDDLTPLQCAWLFRVRQVADSMAVPRYSETALRNALAELRGLMAAPEEVRHVPEILARCGVRFMVVEPFAGSGIDGVCFWLNGDQGQPVVAMTLRYDRIDNFWFVLRHELEHALKRHAWVDINLDQPSRDVSVQEAAATAAAAEFAFPGGDLESFIARNQPIFSERHILDFAAGFRVHPGIVVGQLQHRLNRFNLLRKHLVGIRDALTATALTDGYGRELELGTGTALGALGG